jgi:hypothetical protein
MNAGLTARHTASLVRASICALAVLLMAEHARPQ